MIRLRISRLFFIALVLMLVLPLSGQQREPYFALSTSRTYAPGEKLTIQVDAHNVDWLEFRVYRINDPVLFFQKLEDLHQFGGRAPVLPGEETWLERFHDWKHEWRATVRDFFRRQFKSESRSKIRDWWLERQRPPKTPQPQPTEFAQVPVLNQQQLVSTWKQPVAAHQYWESLTVPVDVPGKGLFLVEAVNGQLRAYTILSVSELGIVTKSAPGHILAFVQHRVSSVPVADCAVYVWSKKKEIARTKTDANGIAEASFADQRPEDTLVLARNGDDFAVAQLYSWFLSTDPNRYLTGYIYSDRPVYRPGHTVYFKGVLRTQLGANYRVPEAREVQVEIQDPENNAVYRKALALSANGTFHGEFAVPETAALGYYSIVVHAGETTVEGGFHVEEYKKPEYEVRVQAEKNRVLQGESIKATIEAKYYFGEPVAGGKVKYVVHTSRYWFPLYAAEEDEDLQAEGEGEGEEYNYGNEQEAEESGVLDADGKLTVTIPTRVNDKKLDLRYRIEARVTDAGNREIAGHGYVTATYGSYLVHAEPDQYVYKPGDTARVNVEARDYEGKPIAATVRVELHPWRWNEQDTKPIYSAESRTDASGATRVDIPLREGGSYIVKVFSTTPENRTVEATAWIWVSGWARGWYTQRGERVQIIPDKKSYKPGDTARVLILTGVENAHILVTAEGRELGSYQVVKAEGSVTVEVPIRAEYAPNFFVSVAFLRDNQLYTGSKKIKVPPTERQLTVEVQPSKPQYQPGEPAVYTLTAKDSAGKPVAGAELSLGVVDEAIYAIRPEVARDITQFFYGDVYNRVGTNTSLSFYFHGAAGKRAMQLALKPPARRELAQLKPEKLVEPKIRKAFPDTTYWSPELITDAAGRAQVRFAFPDSLTTWRATARGITRDTKVGSAVQRTIVRKNLILRLAVPRFFTEGDEVTLSLLVHNYLTSEKKARVSLAAEGVDILEGETRDVSIPSRGDAKLDWRVRAKPGREVKLLGKALTNEESDAVELTLPIVPFGVKLADARAGSIADRNAAADTELTFPQATVPTSHALEISLTPSIAGTIFGALDYLTAYPYGCTEQTMSSFLPNIVVAKAVKELGLKSTVDEKELKKKVRAGLDRLYDFQHEDGGWGWWQTDDSHAFMTAYVLGGLVQARDAGYPVREDVIENGQKWLRAAFDRERRAYPDLRAYMAYSLALSGLKDKAVLDAVWEQRSGMTAYGVALLGTALDLSSDMRAQEIASQLEAQAKSDAQETYWQGGDHNYLMDYYGDIGPEATAFAMKLLTRLRPNSPLLPKAALWLVNHRNEGYWWSSTQQTAVVIFGFTDYLKVSGELRPNFSVSVTVNGKSVLTRRFTEADALAPVSPVIRLSAEQLANVGPGFSPASAKIHITKTGEGRLYWSARAEYYSTEERFARTGSVSLNLLREYFKLTPVREGQKIVHRVEPLAGPVAPGDVIAVRLTVSGGDWRYLMVEDPIPAGAEFIERDDLYEIKDRPSWWYFWCTRREFHDNRAVFFQTYFPHGQMQYLYLLKVVNPGRFRVSAARVQPMYQPQFVATTESKVVEVK